MMPPVVRSVAAPSEYGWTGNKRCRTIGGLGSSSSDTTDAMLIDYDSDTRPQVQDEWEGFVFSAEDDIDEEPQEEQGGQEREEFVFSAEDDIDEELLSHCCKELSSRENSIYVQIAPRLKGKDKAEVYERLCHLRFREYKIWKEGSLNWDDTTAAVPEKYPDEVSTWEDPLKPGPSLFGWTIDPQYFSLAQLDDYQRIVPTRDDFKEYLDWEKYRLTFSSYEADEEYVKYWDELSKKMKWVEGALLLDEEQFLSYEYRGARQAMKIAAGFYHLPASLATLGYEEYVCGLQYDLDCRNDYDQVFFEVWKRVSKQEMSFEEALKDILSSENKLSSSCWSRIQAEIEGNGGQMCRDFSICMDHIREHVEDGDAGAVLKKHFTDAVDSKIPRPKMYVDYAKMKLEVARRVDLIPGTELREWARHSPRFLQRIE